MDNDALLLGNGHLDVETFVNLAKVLKGLVDNLIDFDFGFSFELVVVDFRQEEQ